MFSALSEYLGIASLHLVIYATDSVAATAHLQAFAFILPKVLGVVGAPPAPTDCGIDVVATIIVGIKKIVQVLTGVGIGLAIVGIIAGGLMRATSFGNERRIAMSNTAITCAVVGLIIVLLGTGVGNELPSWFGFGPGGAASCTIGG